MDKPLVSIICTVYNKAKFLEEALASFEAQETPFPVEILLIDDASTDKSREIMETFASQSQKEVRLFYNEQNLGIAKTWKKICLEARGDYIARCDGDDFWLASDKLAKQVQVIQDHPDCQWVTTDISLVDEDGQVQVERVFQDGHMPVISSFEEMLATRGFTAPSTWLIERQLMLAVNDEMDETTADDTFDLQLDLFQKTQKYFLAETMVAYRVNSGSDSRPRDMKKVEERFYRLLETQKSYLDKYPQSDKTAMLELLLDRSNTFELTLSRLSVGPVSQIWAQEVTIYFAKEGQGFDEDSALRFPLQKKDKISFEVPDNVTHVRVDLSEIPSCYKGVSLVDRHFNTDIIAGYTSGIRLGNGYIFPDADPQLVYDIGKYQGRELTLSYEMFNVDDMSKPDYIANLLGLDLQEKEEKLARQEEQLVRYQTQNKQLQAQLEEMVRQYNAVTHSRRWRYPSKIIDVLRRH
ncbi:glycosyltransferase [Streptococcus sp. DD12]|uniref:glycosyltransferase n=1 Tax=Streptococcus sp. DD12 TaxID=1777880 RepID=UPI00079313EC|nr:glycosyltransferase [Streptococcus sp. DD12]KXT76905.1 putative glycosyltransferase [Streptococcus sp. DD12]